MITNKLIYGAIACLSLVALPACEDDYSECSTPHFYGPNENPPLKGSDALNSNASMTIKMGDTEGHVLSLNDYADAIGERMGMSIDEVFAGLDNGKVAFNFVNPNRRVWDRTPANAGDNTWALSPSGIITDVDKAAILVTFDKGARSLTYRLTENAPSGIIPVVCGFAKTDDSSYPVNFRLQNLVTVADKSIVDVTGVIPTGDYAAYSVEMAEYADNIAYALGITDLQKLSSGLGDTEIRDYDLYLLKPSGERVGNPDGGYTANPPGYWADNNYDVCAWGAAGFTYFVEGDFYEEVATGDWQPRADGGAINIGRAPGIASGTNMQINFVIVSTKNPGQTLTFLCNMTFE